MTGIRFRKFAPLSNSIIFSKAFRQIWPELLQYSAVIITKEIFIKSDLYGIQLYFLIMCYSLYSYNQTHKFTLSGNKQLNSVSGNIVHDRYHLCIHHTIDKAFGLHIISEITHCYFYIKEKCFKHILTYADYNQYLAIFSLLKHLSIFRTLRNFEVSEVFSVTR